MPETSAVLNLPYIQPAQAQKHVTHNEAIRLLDALVQLSVVDQTLSSPPASPTRGDAYVIAAGASALWAGHDEEIAVFEDPGWMFIAPKQGWRAHSIAQSQTIIFDGSIWNAPAEGAAFFGINTSADATNRLAVSSPATLLTHEGSDHQVKVNKAGISDTASLLFQTNWSGRAEMGLSGSDAFAIKVSADGSTWFEAFSFDPTSGIATGQAVQQSATDTTPGRLMRADWGYGPGTVLGTVSESSGTPTGSVIEAGSNANGDFTRWADGTQICRTTITLAFVDAQTISLNWTFPAAFSAAPILSAALDASTLVSNATPDITEVTAIHFDSLGSTSATALLKRISGLTDFVSGDTANAMITATGRWF